MKNYFLKRLLWSIPTLWMITLLIFGFSKCAPGDAVTQLTGSNDDNAGATTWQEQADNYRLRAKQYHLDKPDFYFSITSSIFPDSFANVQPQDKKELLGKLIVRTGDARQSSSIIQHLESLMQEAKTCDTALYVQPPAAEIIRLLHDAPTIAETAASYHSWHESWQKDQESLGKQTSTATNQALQYIQSQLQNLSTAPAPSTFYAPRFQWHGSNNQYHHWVSGLLRGDWGTSYFTRQPVWTTLRARLWRTVCINLVAIVLAFCLAIPLGVYMARQADSRTDRWLTRIMLAMFSTPIFWIGSLLILFFATPKFGMQLFRFGCSSLGEADQSTWAWLTSNFSCLVLPIICIMLHLFALVFLQMRSSTVTELAKPYIRTAQAKGVKPSAVLWKHAFRTAVYPIVMLLGGVLPALLSGSLVVEYLFNLPGLGTATFEAFAHRDYPVLFAILLLSAIITILGHLLSDMAYTFLDPRVRF